MTGMPISLPTSIGKPKIPSAMMQVTDCPVAEFNDRLDPNYFCVHVFWAAFFSFFFFGSAAIVDFVNGKQCIRALFTVPQITLFSHFFIKNGSHSTIYIFKNYFATVFSVSVFSFSKNKLNPNTPIYTPWFFFQNFGGAMAP